MRRIWERTTTAANLLYDRARHVEAQAAYDQCLNISQSSFKLMVSTNDEQRHILPMLIVSIANSARNLDAMNRREDAQRLLADYLEIIATPIYDQITSDEVKESILQHLPRLAVQAGNFLEGVGGLDDVLAASIDAAKTAAGAYFARRSRRYIH